MHQSGFEKFIPMHRSPHTFVQRALLLVIPFFLAAFSSAEKTAFDLAKLKLPDGFHISVFADNIDSARMLTFSPGGVLLVSESGEGKVVALPDPKHTGKAARVVDVLSGLNEPHGIAFYEGKLYVAENDKVRRYDWDEANLRATNPTKLADLPTGGGHSTRSIVFHGGKMYISAGSSCNVCVEKDPRRAAVMEFNPDGSGQKIFAKGLRNAVGVAENPKTDTVWVTVNGRDWLGDDLPPETIYDLGKDGGDGGWPYCYGDRVPDSNFTKAGDNRCQNVLEPRFRCRRTPLRSGSAFYEGSMFPPEYRNNIFVAFHGSWNRSVPTGYKVVRVKLDDKGHAGRRGTGLHHWMACSRRNQTWALDGPTGGNCVWLRWIDVCER